MKWFTNPGEETDFEKEYIEKILFKKTKPNLVIYSGDLDSKVISQDVLHLSDEALRENYNGIGAKNIILRTYFNPLLSNKNIFTLPLGFQSGYLEKDSVFGKRKKYRWTFIGQTKSHRQIMVNTFEGVKPNYLHFTNGWNSKDNLSVESVKKIYKQTIFVLCPFGNVNPDSFRIMEALESGCIPVVIKFYNLDYYRYIFGDYPFILGDNWDDAKRKVLFLMKDELLLKNKQKEVEEWYKHYKQKLSNDVVNILKRKGRIESEQFNYQSEAKADWWIKVIFWYHFKFKYNLNISKLLGKKT